MIDFICAAFLSWYCLVALILIAIYVDNYNADAWCTFFVLCGIIWVKVTYDLTYQSLLIYAAIYGCIGILWSIFRWMQYCKSVVQEFTKRQADVDARRTIHEPSLSAYIDKLKPKNNMAKIVNWVFSWPISFINTVCHDVYSLVGTIIQKYFIGIYNKISNSAIDKLQ